MFYKSSLFLSNRFQSMFYNMPAIRTADPNSHQLRSIFFEIRPISLKIRSISLEVRSARLVSLRLRSISPKVRPISLKIRSISFEYDPFSAKVRSNYTTYLPDFRFLSKTPLIIIMKVYSRVP